MHWSKRTVFFLTLVAFLSNFAYGLSVPNVQEPNLSLGTSFTKFQQKLSAELTFSAYESLEELEEFEHETDLDTDAVTKVVGIQDYKFRAADKIIYNSQSQGLSFEQDAFRSWLWLKQAIFIHFEVFRI